MRADVLVGSAAVHAAALALFIHWLPPKEAPPSPRRAVVAPRAEEPPPLDITIVELPPDDGPAVAGIAAGMGGASDRAAAGTHVASDRAVAGTRIASHRAAAGDAVAASQESPGISGGNEPPAHAPAGGGLLRMRGPDLGLAPGVAERIAAGGDRAPGHARESGKLENVSGGGAVIHDRVTTVAIERDGTAHFHDKPDIEFHLHAPIPHIDLKADMHELGDALEDWYRDPYAATRYGPSTDLSELNLAVPGMCDTWGDLGCDDPLASDAEKRARNRQNGGGVGVHGPADLTAYLMRKLAHTDPYASRKLALLDDTRAERIERGEQFRAEQAARSAELMQKTLEQLWASTRDPAARRAALHDLWADCADDEAGARARAMVIGWIRAKLPAGSPDAYTPDELAHLGFDPYENDR